MIYIPDFEIERITEEDISPFDLTSSLLGIESTEGILEYSARNEIVLCCTEQVKRIFELAGLNVEMCLDDSSLIREKEIFFRASGRGDRLHIAWKNGLRIFEYFCGISTRTRNMVSAAKSVNPDIEIGVTRKFMPGTKNFSVAAAIAGGALPHRLGLSETVLIFDHHMSLLGGEDKVINILPQLKKKAAEKKIGIEAKNMESALKFAEAGFDYVQLDKFKPDEAADFCRKIRGKADLTVGAAGGINLDNAGIYASTGVDVLITSSVYSGRPADIKTDIIPVQR